MNVVFVAPYLARATLRFTEAIAAVPGARLGLLTQEPADRVPAPLRAALAAHWRVGDALDPDQIVAAVRGLSGAMGGRVERLLGVLEHLQVPIAEARERLGIEGMNAETARNFRDKARMKTLLRAAGLPCPRHRLVASADEAKAFVSAVGFPIVMKPPEGAGALSTFRVDDAAALAQALAATPPAREKPVLLEEFVTGRESSFDSVAIDGRVVWHSFSHYLPAPLEVLRHSWIQWCVFLPRRIDGPRYDNFREVGCRALAALGMRTGLSHMEWFERADGSIAISEVGARPPGAQFTSLLSYAHDHDFYRAWARLMIDGRFDPPARRYAVGAVYLRAQGAGRQVAHVHGLDLAQAEVGPLVVEAELPRAGQTRQGTYEGDGYVILRHPETEVVERAVARLLELVRVEAASVG
jgi:hypothetical protein